MKDIPVFVTEYGAASLILKEIPYLGTAYVTIQDSVDPEQLIRECRDFCRMCGAERIFFSGHPALEAYPVETVMIQMRILQSSLERTDAALWPVQENTLDRWREIYNGKVKHLSNGAWMTESEGKRMLDSGEGYFVHKDGKLLGIGKVSGNEIQWVASVCPGAGADVIHALANRIFDEDVILTVSSANKKAMDLYQRIGFIPVKELSRWYRVL